MKTIDVLMVKIYITEASKMLDPILHYLKNEAKIRGVSVFRAISGYGETGVHATTWVDLSLDLPLTVEFFDSKEKIEIALEYLTTQLKSEHIVVWAAKVNDN